MEIFTVSFFGHRRISDPIAVEKRLEKLIGQLLRTKEYLEFLVGRDGEFDQLAASAVRRCVRAVRSDNSALFLVLPYATAQYRSNADAFREYYDEVEIYPDSANKHFKAAHQARNRVMVDRSDLVVFCVEQLSGGAYQTMKYAQRNNSSYINIAYSVEESFPERC